MTLVDHRSGQAGRREQSALRRLAGPSSSTSRVATGFAAAAVLGWIAWALVGDRTLLLPGMLAAVGFALLVVSGRRLTIILAAVGLLLTTSIYVEYVTPPDWDFGYTVGSRSVAPLSASGAEPGITHGIGSLEIDLTRTKLPDSPRIVATTQIGRLTVTVPTGVNVDVRARAGAGSVELFGQQRSVLGATLVASENVPNAGGTLQLDLSVGVGSIEVRR